MISADGATVYVTGRDRQLWALNAADGKVKWAAPLEFQPQTPPTVSPEGLIVAGGGPGARLVGLRDAGDRAEVLWRRDDVTPLTATSQAGPRAGYVVVADGPDRLALLVFNPADGGRTVNSSTTGGESRSRVPNGALSCRSTSPRTNPVSARIGRSPYAPASAVLN